MMMMYPQTAIVLLQRSCLELGLLSCILMHVFHHYSPHVLRMYFIIILRRDCYIH